MGILCLFNNASRVGISTITRTWNPMLSSRFRICYFHTNHRIAGRFVATQRIGTTCKHSYQYQCGGILRNFHTSTRRLIGFPPIIWILVKPLAKGLSIITGRSLRNWWRAQHPEVQKEYLKKLHPKRHYLLAGAALVGLVAAFNYWIHLQTTPVTNRQRYIAFTDSQLQKIIQFEFEQQWENVQEAVVAPTHPVYDMVLRIMRKLIDANQDLEFFKSKTWRVVVVESKIQNAFVLPNGYIFVFTGMLKSAHNEDQLAFILAHEMSHALLNHAAEKLSVAQVLDVLLIFVMGAIWFYMPNDGVAVVTQWFYNKCMKIMLDLPYSRKLETEADEVGLQLMAKACYDVRESSAFWSHLDIQEEMETEIPLPEFTSTHPNYKTRVKFLDSKMDEAIECRKSCKCAPVKGVDPRKELEELLRLVKESRKEEPDEKVTGNKPPPVVASLPGKEVAIQTVQIGKEGA